MSPKYLLHHRACQSDLKDMGPNTFFRCTHLDLQVVHVRLLYLAGIRQHTSAYVSIRQHTSAYVSIRQHTSAYCLKSLTSKSYMLGCFTCSAPMLDYSLSLTHTHTLSHTLSHTHILCSTTLSLSFTHTCYFLVRVPLLLTTSVVGRTSVLPGTCSYY
jgi:hypothetical protein